MKSRATVVIAHHQTHRWNQILQTFAQALVSARMTGMGQVPRQHAQVRIGVVAIDVLHATTQAIYSTSQTKGHRAA